MQTRNSVSRLGLVVLLGTLSIAAGVVNTPMAQAQSTKTSAPAKAQDQAKKNLVDVNTADAETLQGLPGIGPALAQRIMDGRPYKNLEDLENVKGLGKAKVDALKTDVSFGPSRTAKGAKTGSATPQAKKAQTETKTPAQAKIARVDVNSADAETLQGLPGVGPAIGQRIIDGRPYKNLEDLEKVKGLGKAKVDALKTDITFGPSKTAKSAAAASAEAKVIREKESPVTRLTPTGAASGKLRPGEKININKATAEDLDSLPGIGPVKSQAIVAYRNQNGEFKTIEDIQQVRGIKEGEFSKLKDLIKLKD